MTRQDDIFDDRSVWQQVAILNQILKALGSIQIRGYRKEMGPDTPQDHGKREKSSRSGGRGRELLYLKGA